MSLNNPYQTYKQNTVTTASPGELTLMLYNGCIKFIKQAKDNLAERKFEQKNTNIIKAQNIIRELMVTLNMDYEISKQMLQMYDYIVHLLVNANIKNDSSLLDEAEGFVTEFRDTWKLVIQRNRQMQYNQGK